MQVFGIARTLLTASLLLSVTFSANAGGWATVHRFVHKSGKCIGSREVLASHYRIGSKTATGEKFNPHGLTAASHDYPLGTTITAMNPLNGRSCSVRINDRGPYGMARKMGARIDFALGAARCLGMHGTQYICTP
jgi:rare lipoprotein A (peptidoglycan hydrolase)